MEGRQIGNHYERAHKTLTNNFRLIIAKTNSVARENLSNRYLLITLQMIGDELYVRSTVLPVKKIMTKEYKYTRKVTIL